MLSTPGWDSGSHERPFLPRACSVLRVRPNNELQFLLDRVGPGTERLCQLDEGNELLILGPFGNGFDLSAQFESTSNQVEHVFLIGGGVGIAPLAILADEFGHSEHAPSSLSVLLGFRNSAFAAAADLFSTAEIASDDGSVGFAGSVIDLFCRKLDDKNYGPVQVFACGPPPMLEALRKVCGERAISAQFALEAEMACGFGACFGCVVQTKTGYRRLCVDGPVIRADELENCDHPVSRELGDIQDAVMELS